MKFLTPSIFLLAAVGIAVANARNEAVVWYLPFDNVWPELAGDYQTQGQYTVATFAFLGGLTLLRAWFRQDRQRPE